MRPAGKSLVNSLYFAYPAFRAGPVPATGSARSKHQVVVVGGGPVGLAAALSLAVHGVRSVVLDRRSTVSDGSRAICVSRHSFDILQRIRVGRAFEKKALGWRRSRTYFNGVEINVSDLPFEADDRYYPMYNIQQQYTELFLLRAAEATGSIDLRWHSSVTGLHRMTPGEILLDVMTPDGGYDIAAEYVIAADGARSTVRELLGLRLDGTSYRGRYMITDIKMLASFPTERRAFFSPSETGETVVLIHKQPDDIWRVDYQLKDDEDPEAALDEGRVRERIAAVLRNVGHNEPWELEWWSVYSVHAATLADYLHGRVLFVGDSARIVPIFGVRGLNNGLADAHNLGWKLAYVMGGRANPSILKSYTRERRPAALQAFDSALKSIRLVAPPSAGWSLVTHAALSLALRDRAFGGVFEPRWTAPQAYGEGESQILLRRHQEFAAGPSVGSVCSNAMLANGDFLLDYVGTGFFGLFFSVGDDERMEEAILVVLRRLDPGFTLLVVTASPQLCVVGMLSGRVKIADHSRRVWLRYDAVRSTFYLVRPDLHVAGRWRTIVLSEVVEVMGEQLGLPFSGRKLAKGA